MKKLTNPMFQPGKKNRGFGLVEVLLVLFLIGGLTAIVLLAYRLPVHDAPPTDAASERFVPSPQA